ncbi:MAG: ring-cleaving dioxygenase [Bacteroidetes bacterium]|nr:MAG: ring-cleaving dioxygenase [Bacteroidota bacterium]
MNSRHILGLHHLTATVDDAQEDLDFYIALLGLRLVKKTVNFDNHRVYHFYYGNRLGEPGTIMTTFPYKGEGVRIGTPGSGQVDITSFSVPAPSIGWWRTRLRDAGVEVKESDSFGKAVLAFRDPSGLNLQLVGDEGDTREPWTGSGVPAEAAIRGLHSVTLSLGDIAADQTFLTEELGFAEYGSEGPVTRYAIQGGGPGQYLDLRDDRGLPAGLNGIGTVHHVAFRVADMAALLEIRTRVAELGLKPTEVKDRNYFKSIYFRIPGKVLFEVATIPPGFTADESEATLGQALKLPEWEEPNRALIESVLPAIHIS